MKVTTNTGHEIDEAEAARMAAAFEADDETVAEALRQPVKRRGRPRLKGTTGKRSPKIEFRVGEEFHHKAALLAERENRSVNALAREATEMYLRQHQ